MTRIFLGLTEARRGTLKSLALAQSSFHALQPVSPLVRAAQLARSLTLVLIGAELGRPTLQGAVLASFPPAPNLETFNRG